METKRSVTNAVLGLRTAIGETQQEFAYRMKTAIRTIARWETVRPPRGKALADLARVAEETGQKELAGVFRTAISKELGTWDTSEFESIGIEPRTETEKLWTAALLATLRNPEFDDVRVKLIPLLRRPAEACIKNIEHRKLSARLEKETNRLLDMGVEPEMIAKDLNVPEADVRKYAVMRRMVRAANEGIRSADEHSTEKSK
jgi:transcriptional regulator with XRE-family HTH domain